MSLFAATTPLQLLFTYSSQPTQPSILPGSVNENQLRLGRQRQVWFILLADVRSLENVCHTWAP